MKLLLQLFVLAGSTILLVGCETTQTAGMGNQERKHIAAMQRLQAEDSQMDESERNLWNTEQRRLVNQGNPAIRY